MIKVFLFAVVLSGLLVGCNSYIGPEDRANSNPTIKSIKKFNIDKQTDLKLNLVFEKQFSPKGDLLYFVEYASDGNKICESHYEYTESTGTEEKIIYNSNEIVDSTIIIEYLFDRNGNVTRKTTFTKNKLTLDQILFQYDDKGNLVSQLRLNDSGNVTEEIQYYYQFNDNGNLIERITEGSRQNLLISRDSLSYDKSNQSVDVVNINSSGVIQTITTYIYNIYGDTEFEIISQANGKVIEKYLYEYSYH